MSAAVATVPTDPYAARERHHNEGHGRRLTAAFEALEAFPVLVESRNRVLRLFRSQELTGNSALNVIGVLPRASSSGADRHQRW